MATRYLRVLNQAYCIDAQFDDKLYPPQLSSSLGGRALIENGKAVRVDRRATNKGSGL